MVLPAFRSIPDALGVRWAGACGELGQDPCSASRPVDLTPWGCAESGVGTQDPVSPHPLPPAQSPVSASLTRTPFSATGFRVLPVPLHLPYAPLFPQPGASSPLLLASPHSLKPPCRGAVIPDTVFYPWNSLAPAHTPAAVMVLSPFYKWGRDARRG